MARQTAKDIKKIFDNLKGDRGNWENYWQDLARYCVPRKSYITRQRATGEKLDPDIYDSTAISSAQMLAAGLQGFLTNPAQKWFTLALQDRELMADQAVKEWLKEAEEKIFDTLNGSNFNQQIFEVYQDLGVFGTATLFEEEDEREIVRFSARPIDEIFVMEDKREVITTVYRKYRITAKQAFDRWGNNSGENVLTAVNSGKLEEKIDFLHCVRPRGERDVSKKDARNMPFSSVFVNMSQLKKVGEGGFEEFPFFVPRFNKVSGEKYGYSPAMTVLAEILMVNEMKKTNLKAGQLAVAPPLQVPHDGYLLPIKTSPNSLNYRNPGFDKDRIEPLFTGSDVRLGQEMITNEQETIKRAFFADLFLILSQAKGPMTATEVIQRAEEKLLLLGPVLGRLMNELLNPLISRTFFILLRNRLISPPPSALQGQDFIIEYISVLARAQKQAESRGIDSFLLRVGGMAQINPEVVDKVDTDKVVDEIAKIEGVPPTIVRDKDAVEVIRVERQAQQAQVAQLAATQQVADIAKTGSEANKNLEEKE